MVFLCDVTKQGLWEGKRWDDSFFSDSVRDKAVREAFGIGDEKKEDK